jgi:hypothetical protein
MLGAGENAAAVAGLSALFSRSACMKVGRVSSQDDSRIPWGRVGGKLSVRLRLAIHWGSSMVVAGEEDRRRYHSFRASSAGLK